MSTAIQMTVNMETVDCGICGGVYALSADYLRKKRETGGFWHCPYCYTDWGYPKNRSELVRLKQQLEQKEAEAQRMREHWLAEERSRISLQGHLTRVKHRIGNGVCPCCNRSFKNIRRHMQSKHPHFAKEEK